MKIKQIPTWVFIVAGGLLILLFANVLDPVHLNETSFYNRKWIAIPCFLIVLFGMPMLFGYYEAKVRSPVVRWPGGHGTYDPIKAHTMKAPKGKGTAPLPYDFRVVPLNSFKALQVYQKGGGKHGVHVVLNIPGMVVEAGVNLDINAEVSQLYVGLEEKKKIWWIHQQLKKFAKTNKYAYDIDSPVWVSVIPAEYLPYAEETKQELEGWWENMTFWQKQVKDLSDQNKRLTQTVQRMETRKLRETSSVLESIKGSGPDDEDE